MPVLTRSAEPLALMFADDGSIPNNPRLPFLVYRGAIDLTGTPNRRSDREDLRPSRLGRDVAQRHLSLRALSFDDPRGARHRARPRQGAVRRQRGRGCSTSAGDVVVLPAGTGHQCLWAAPELWSSAPIRKSGKYDLCRGSKAEHANAVDTIPSVPLPDTDPVFGEDGPLTKLWR